jgi:CRP-like cAMP-binding protein
MNGRSEFQARNRLLGALSASDYALVHPQLKQVELLPDAVLQDQGERIQYVYFPLSGVISVLSVMHDGKAVQTAAIGRDGSLGASYGLGGLHSFSRVAVQIPGSAARIAGPHFQRAVKESEHLRDLIVRYKELRLAQSQQSAACNALHGAEARLSRWLLHTGDVIDGDVIPLTQEYLSQILGVRRTTVTDIARSLQRAGVIRYTRGRIEVSDREKLKKSSCECYEVLRSQSQNLFRQKR